MSRSPDFYSKPACPRWQSGWLHDRTIDQPHPSPIDRTTTIARRPSHRPFAIDIVIAPPITPFRHYLIDNQYKWPYWPWLVRIISNTASVAQRLDVSHFHWKRDWVRQIILMYCKASALTSSQAEMIIADFRPPGRFGPRQRARRLHHGQAISRHIASSSR